MKTINHECYVSLEVAKLLKQVGFDWEVTHFYFSPDSSWINPSFEERDYYEADNYNNDGLEKIKGEKHARFISAPTLDIAQRWLREVKHTHIDTFPSLNSLNNWAGCIYSNDIDNCSTWDGFNTYEEAQEAGIKKVLEIILKEGE